MNTTCKMNKVRLNLGVRKPFVRQVISILITNARQRTIVVEHIPIIILIIKRDIHKIRHVRCLKLTYIIVWIKVAPPNHILEYTTLSSCTKEEEMCS